ncbi:MAG: sigma-70 family RNA polymerase sigma factor [Clostridiales bacterium]|nr:sigma-70 family RNA polymerase sigma factor [Clostridiales bacterium]
MSFKYTSVKKEDTYALIALAQNGDSNAKEQIVEQNTGLVKNIALKFLGTGYELEDLLQIGFMGLLKAIDRFDVHFNVMFSTYAVPMILGEIKRYMRDDGRIKMSRQLKLDIRSMKQFQEEYYNQKGVSPKLSELAEMMGVDIARIVEIIDASDALSNLESLDHPDRQETPLSESYLEAEDKAVDRIHLKMIIGKLTDRERQIITLRYFKDMTQQQIAEKIGISQVQVSRIEKKVLESIRKDMLAK